MADVAVNDENRRSDSELATGVIESTSVIKQYLPRNEDVLEVGCGYGYFTSILIESKNRVTAIDISKPAIDYCLDKYSGKAQFHAADIIGFSTDRKFNSALIVNVLDQIQDDTGALRKIRSLLMPGGRLILGTPISKMRYIKASVHRYSEDELRKKIFDCGFVVEKTIYAGGTLTTFAKFLSDKFRFPKWLLRALRALPFYRGVVEFDAKAGLRKDAIVMICKNPA
ncbi:MAG TPA: class I SAM-dependent methyltransferase [archaeon]|nr:class I SAM-dependent methyltransferase [archaeon]